MYLKPVNTKTNHRKRISTPHLKKIPSETSKRKQELEEPTNNSHLSLDTKIS